MKNYDEKKTGFHVSIRQKLFIRLFYWTIERKLWKIDIWLNMFAKRLRPWFSTMEIWASI